MTKLLRNICILSLCAASLLAVGCSQRPPERYEQKFHDGDFVKMKIDGRMGMVLYVTSCQKTSYDFHRSCNYYVRIPTGSIRTDTRVLSEDGSLKTSPYEIIKVSDYELEPAGR